jgi:hypothetical protein
MSAPNLKIVSSADSKKPRPVKGKTTASRGRRSTYDSIKSFALDGLSDLLRVLMENVDDALFERSEKVDNDHERNLYFEAMREIRKKRERLHKSFDYEMQRCLEGFVRQRAAVVEFDEDDELTLVEFDEMEDKIAIDNMITRARPHFEDELFAVTERLRAVSGRDKIDEDENPLDPKAICESFHTASDLLETEIRIKLIFYKLFEKYVMNNLGHFYRELNQQFAKHGVLPDFSADKERRKQTTRFMANRIKPGSAPNSPGGTATGPVRDPGSEGDGNLFASLQQAASNCTIRTAGATSIYGGTGAAGASPAGGPIAAGGQLAENENFVSALSSLQAASIESQPPITVDPESLKATAHRQMTDIRQQNQLATADSQTIDVVSMLFDFFFDDEALPAPIKVLIGRLQIPILKVAILDKDFFNKKKHPARRLLDGISRASMGWGENHKDATGLIAKTEQLVNFLINEFEEDISIFEKACTDFENFVTRENKKRERAEAALRKKEQQRERRVKAAIAAAEALIGKLTRKRELSDEVMHFLETTWTSVLFKAYLSLGESSNHWRNLKRISTTFVWTLVPKHTEAERSKIIKTIPHLLRALSRGMELIKIDMEVQNRIFRVLAQEHAKIVKQTSRNIVTRVDDTTVWPEDDGARAFDRAGDVDASELPAGAADGIEVIENDSDDDSITIIDAAETNDVIKDLNQFTAGVKQGQIRVEEEIVLVSADGEDFDLVDGAGDEYAAMANRLEVGAWVEFTRDDGNQIARLSWKSKVTGDLVFANRNGNMVKKMTTSGFATELRAARARCIESSSVFDRAIYTIMSKI